MNNTNSKTNSNTLSTKTNEKRIDLSKAPEIIDKGMLAVNTVKQIASEAAANIEKADAAFIQENTPHLDDMEIELLKAAWERKEMTTPEVLKYKREREEDKLRHREQLYEQRNKRTQTICKNVAWSAIGVGVGVGVGFGLYYTIPSLFNRNRRS